MLLACAALDGTAKKEYPQIKEVGQRFKKFIQDNIDIIEVMFGGLELKSTLFPFKNAKGAVGMKFEDIIYEKYRCSLAHGDELEQGFEIELAIVKNKNLYRFVIDTKKQYMTMPESVIYALGLPCVLAKTNSDQTIGNNKYHYYDIRNRYIVDEWWGRIDEARKIMPFDEIIKLKHDFSKVWPK